MTCGNLPPRLRKHWQRMEIHPRFISWWQLFYSGGWDRPGARCLGSLFWNMAMANWWVSDDELMANWWFMMVDWWLSDGSWQLPGGSWCFVDGWWSTERLPKFRPRGVDRGDNIVWRLDLDPSGGNSPEIHRSIQLKAADVMVNHSESPAPYGSVGCHWWWFINGWIVKLMVDQWLDLPPVTWSEEPLAVASRCWTTSRR